jgi:hypothetical protein
MHKRSLAKKHFLRIPLHPIPRNTVISVSQLGGSNRNPINEQGQIDGLLRLPNAVMQLPSKCQYISSILSKRINGECMPGPKISQINLHPPIPHTLPQHIQNPARINLGRNPLPKLPLRYLRIPVQPGKPLPPLRLRSPNEPKKLPSINPKPSTKRPLPPLPPPPKQLLLNQPIKSRLGIIS